MFYIWNTSCPSVMYTTIFYLFQAHMLDFLDLFLQTNCLGDTYVETYATLILDAKYKKVDIIDVACSVNT